MLRVECRMAMLALCCAALAGVGRAGEARDGDVTGAASDVSSSVCAFFFGRIRQEW